MAGNVIDAGAVLTALLVKSTIEMEIAKITAFPTCVLSASNVTKNSLQCRRSAELGKNQFGKIDIADKIPYKVDEDTLSGKYRKTGHTRISKYYE